MDQDLRPHICGNYSICGAGDGDNRRQLVVFGTENADETAQKNGPPAMTILTQVMRHRDNSKFASLC